MQTDDKMPLRSELLCFVADKCHCMAFDDVVKLCVDFYKWDEVVEARTLLNQCLPEERLAKRKGADRVRVTLEDILKIVLDPNVELPIFYAVNISRLPPVDAVHCDVAAILKELSLLRQEVRAVAQLREEVAGLRLLINNCTDLHISMASVERTTEPVKTGTNGTTSFADKVKAVPNKPIVARNKILPTVGTSTRSDRLKSVMTTRVVDLFVSRLHPSTSPAELEDCINEANSNDRPINIIQVGCTSLKPKFEGMYSSFHIAVRVDATELNRAVELLMSPLVWPAGILVRRYFKPKNGSRVSTDN
jgi:hypothetical protein